MSNEKLTFSNYKSPEILAIRGPVFSKSSCSSISLDVKIFNYNRKSIKSSNLQILCILSNMTQRFYPKNIWPKEKKMLLPYKICVKKFLFQAAKNPQISLSLWIPLNFWKWLGGGMTWSWNVTVHSRSIVCFERATNHSLINQIIRTSLYYWSHGPTCPQ